MRIYSYTSLKDCMYHLIDAGYQFPHSCMAITVETLEKQGHVKHGKTAVIYDRLGLLEDKAVTL